MKLLRLTITVLFFFSFISGVKTHEYYVSVTTIEYVKAQQSLQIISQIFSNDFEKLLKERYDETITLDTKEESKPIDAYIERYLSKALRLKINDSIVNFSFLGKAYKEDITYCYLEVENITELKTIEISNRILFDAFSAQQNIVKLKVGTKNKSFLLIPENDTCVLNF